MCFVVTFCPFKREMHGSNLMLDEFNIREIDWVRDGREADAAVRAAASAFEQMPFQIVDVGTMTSARLDSTVRRWKQARSFGERIDRLGEVSWADVRLHVPAVKNRATGKSMGGVRAQFATEVNIQMSLYSIPFYATFEERTGETAGYRPQGYLFLATGERQLQQLNGSELGK